MPLAPWGSPWCAAAGGSCLCSGLLEIPWHRGGCVSLAEVGGSGRAVAATTSRSLGEIPWRFKYLYILLIYGFLLTSGVSFLFKAHHLKCNSLPGSSGRSPSPSGTKADCVSFACPSAPVKSLPGEGLWHLMCHEGAAFPLAGLGSQLHVHGITERIWGYLGK